MKILKKNKFYLLDAGAIILAMTVGFLFGNILHEGIVFSELNNGEPDMTVFPLGTIMAMTVLLIYVFIAGAMSMLERFNLLVGNGATRKQFFYNQICSSVVTCLGAVLFLRGLAYIEQLKLSYFWNKLPSELDLQPYMTPLNMGAIIIILIGYTLFIGACILKFGKIGFWFFWGVYMIGCITLTKIEDVLHGVSENVLAAIKSNSTEIIFIVALFAVLGALLSWLLVRKQPVNI